MNYYQYYKMSIDDFKTLLLKRFESMNLSPIRDLKIDSLSRTDDFKEYSIYYTIIAYNRYGQLMESKHIYHINADKFEYIDNSLKVIKEVKQ